MVQQCLTSHSTHYRSFRRQFYRSVEPTNSVIALKDESLSLTYVSGAITSVQNFTFTLTLHVSPMPKRQSLHITDRITDWQNATITFRQPWQSNNNNNNKPGCHTKHMRVLHSPGVASQQVFAAFISLVMIMFFVLMTSLCVFLRRLVEISKYIICQLLSLYFESFSTSALTIINKLCGQVAATICPRPC